MNWSSQYPDYQERLAVMALYAFMLTFESGYLELELV